MTTATKPMYAAPGRRALLNDRAERCLTLINEIGDTLGQSETFHLTPAYAARHHRLEANRDAELDRLRRELIDLRNEAGAEAARTHEAEPADKVAHASRLKWLKAMADERAAATHHQLENFANQGDWRAFAAHAMNYIRVWQFCSEEYPA